jgi:hypothetical protein
MSLYWPADPNIVEHTSRLHALVVGVGDYDHLGLDAAMPAAFLSGLAPLTTTTLSAKRIARWLETEYQNEGCKLGSIELLLSPGETLTRADGSTIAVEEATMTQIDAAFNRWFERCNKDKRNIAFFYFAGHGINTISQFLLPADFGNPVFRDDWENCINFTNMRIGMARCNAQTQMFFVDACRDAPIAALLQRNPHGKSFVSSTYQDRVDLSAVYFASSEGRQAYGRDGEETFFCKALIMCLDGVAARKAGTKWRIDAASLSSGLVSVVAAMAATENLALTSDCSIQKPVPIHFPGGGKVVIKVDCEPDAVKAEATILVTQGADVLSSPAGESRPWMGRIKAGGAKVEVTFARFAPYVVEDQMTPPTYEVEVPPR